MRELFLYALGASVTGTVFFVSLIELIFTVRRNRVTRELEAKLKEIRATYNESINKLVVADDAKLDEAEKQVAQQSEMAEDKIRMLEEGYEKKIEEMTKSSEKALEAAKAKAKKLEHEAKTEAEEYLRTRQKEVEEELMNLVISVTKRVLPEGITYEAQKELIVRALQDVKTESQA